MSKVKTYDPHSVFFTSDTHFFHTKLAYIRGYHSIATKMHDQLIYSWNQTVPLSGIVFFLGDFSFGKTEATKYILNALTGTKIFVKGNHDTVITRHSSVFNIESIHDILEINVSDTDVNGGKQRIVMCHYPMLTWNKAHYGSWHLHGHSHNNLNVTTGKRMDVGVDTNSSLKPYGYYDIKRYMATREFEAVDHHIPEYSE